MKPLIIILPLCMILFFGCWSKNHAFDFNSSSYSSCMASCEDLGDDYNCFEMIPSYHSSDINGIPQSKLCSCYIRECMT